MNQTENKRAALISPCETCPDADTRCTYPDCSAYTWHLNRFLSRCRRQRPEEKRPRADTFCYDPPYLVAENLDTGPCRACSLKFHCRDTESCENYAAWTEARWKRIRRRLGVE